LAAFAGEGEQDRAALTRLRIGNANSSHSAQSFQQQIALIGSQTPRRLTPSEADVEATGPLGCCGRTAAVRRIAPISGLDFCTLFSLCILTQVMSQLLVGNFRRFTSDLS
jgi:hypothetical protein